MNLATNPFNLTDAEFTVARILVQECLDGMGGQRPADLEHDEYTWADPKDLVTSYGYTRHQAAGFFSSLQEKGFVSSDEEPDVFGKIRKSWVVETKGWQWMDTVWDATAS